MYMYMYLLKEMVKLSGEPAQGHMTSLVKPFGA